MKKLSILSVLVVLFASIMLTGCGEVNDAFEPFAPKDTWIEERITVNTNTNLICYLYYNTKTENISVGNQNIKVGEGENDKGKIASGLTLVLKLDSSGSWQGLANNNIAVKTFKTGDKLTRTEDTDESTTPTFSDGLWTAMGLYRKFYNKTISTPSEVKNNTTVVTINDEASWKSILSQLLVAEIIKRLGT